MGVLVCDVTCALMLPSAASGCDAKWNESDVLQMPPPPVTLHVPPDSVWLPGPGDTWPMSSYVHVFGQTLGRAGGRSGWGRLGLPPQGPGRSSRAPASSR